MSIKLPQSTDRSMWNSHVTHPLQSWQWGEFRKKTGVEVKRMVVDGNGKKTYLQLTIHQIPHTPWSIGYIPKGPMPDSAMLETLRDYGKKHNVIYIQLEPNISVEFESRISNLESRLVPSHHPLFTKYTFILDLTKSEDELLQAMHPKTRYNIRLAQKHGVSIQEDNSKKAFEAYIALYKETTNRQAFYAHDEYYHRTMWNTLHPSGFARLWTATYNGQILAAWIVFVFAGRLYYPYGTSSRDHRNVMAPNLLLWEIARWGRANHLKTFDLWGALGPEERENTNDPWYGFHRFKKGFGPDPIEYVGSYDLVIHTMKYRIFVMVNILRWMWLKMSK